MTWSTLQSADQTCHEMETMSLLTHPHLTSLWNCSLTIVGHYHFKAPSSFRLAVHECVVQVSTVTPLSTTCPVPFRCKWGLWGAANLQPGFTALRRFLLCGCSTLGVSGKHLEGTMRLPLYRTLSVPHGTWCDDHSQAVYQFTVRTFL